MVGRVLVAAAVVVGDYFMAPGAEGGVLGKVSGRTVDCIGKGPAAAWGKALSRARSILEAHRSFLAKALVAWF